MHIEIGPVEAAAARAWLAHVIASLAEVRLQQDRLPFRLPVEVADEFEDLLRRWQAHAHGCGPVFDWQGSIDADQAHVLVRYWTNLDSLSDEQVRALGLDWAPPAGRPFFNALAAAVAGALAGHDERGPDAFADRLVGHGRRPVRSVVVA